MGYKIMAGGVTVEATAEQVKAFLAGRGDSTHDWQDTFAQFLSVHLGAEHIECAGDTPGVIEYDLSWDKWYSSATNALDTLARYGIGVRGTLTGEDDQMWGYAHPHGEIGALDELSYLPLPEPVVTAVRSLQQLAKDYPDYFVGMDRNVAELLTTITGKQV